MYKGVKHNTAQSINFKSIVVLFMPTITAWKKKYFNDNTIHQRRSVRGVTTRK